MAYQMAAMQQWQWPWMTFNVVHWLQDFSNAMRRTFFSILHDFNWQCVRGFSALAELLVYYYDLRRRKFLSSVNKKIVFLHKFLSALEFQFHTGVLRSTKCRDIKCQSFSASLYLVILKQWFCDIVFAIVNCVCFLLLFFYLILHMLRIKLYKFCFTKSDSNKPRRTDAIT